MKKQIIGSILLCSSLFATDTNITKEQIFRNKYLQDKSQIQNKISVDELHRNTRDFNLSSVRQDMNLTKDEIENKYEIKFNQSMEANQSAKEISNMRRSEAFEKKIVDNQNYILYDKSMNFDEYLGEYSQNTKDMISQMENSKHLISSNKYLNPNEKIFIVISSSMDKSSIQNYFKLLENVNTDITFVLRGLVGNDARYINPTFSYLQDLLIKDPNNKNKEDKNNFYYFNIEINPKVTRRFNITKTPAVIFIKNYDPIVQDYQKMTNTPADTNEEYYVAYGEVSINYALSEINKQAKSDGLARLIQNMNSNFYTK
ncbi:TrbC family F-type conjugative pilus assembly protein [Campylobacter coli]|uniref:TrbC family F-type conjugative pilus assembly protein n=1 Tax=Campylobacter coli TaxID=195 RepID=UPI00119E8612|nr:TrbC family F-type conjugative pilus assembly protein [Campylobacter coli]